MSQLEELLQQCVVKLTLPGHLGWGTGFFVAPGWILTCAHVVQDARDEFVQVRWQRQENWAQATVERLLADPFDLALLKVTGSTEANLPCVYFDEEIRSRDPLYLFGYPDQDFPNGCPVTFNCEGLTGDESALIKFALGQVRPGMSGSPLLNQRTGKVCGIVKFTRDRSFDLGGGAIPTQVILDQFPELRLLQREFHESDKRWVNLITQPGIDFQPYLQAILANEDYREWQEVYTPTTVEDRRQRRSQDAATVSQHRFSSRLKLRAETVKPDKTEQGDQRKAQESQERVEQWDVLAGLRNYATEHVVLIGKPGSGKSTSLERLLWEEAEKALQDPNARIPVLVKLRRCTGTIEALIRDFIAGHQVALEITQIEELLRQGKFLLLLDGLNELPKAFEIEIANFRDRYRRTTPMIVSTRDLGGGVTLGIEKTLKMLPLTEPQMREFVRGYLGGEGDRLFQQLQGDRLRKFAETPLLLWMLCWVFDQNGKVSDNFGLAFREFTRLYDQDIPTNDLADAKDKWLKPLSHLAFVMMQGKTAIDPQLSIPREEAEDCLTAYLRQEDRINPRECAEQWLKDLLKYHLIQPVIQPNLEEHIEFRHQLIQEYYAAEYLLRLLPNLTDEQLKRDYLNYLKWTEPTALMLALVGAETQALRVVKLAMDDVDLMLGARLAGEVKLEFQSTTVGWIDDFVIPLLLKCQCWEASHSEVAIPGLLNALQHSDSSVRELAAIALGQLGSKAAISGLLSALEEPDVDVRRKTAVVLGQLGSEVAIPRLLNLLKDKDPFVRKEAVVSLGQIGSHKSVVGLINALNDSYWEVRQKSVKSLVQIGGEAALAGLFKALKSKHDLLRCHTAEALGKLGDKRAIPELIEALNDQKNYIREEAAKALARLGSTESIAVLTDLLKSDKVIHYTERQELATLLTNLDDEQVLFGITDALESKSFYDRKIAAEILTGLDSRLVIQKSLGKLNDRDSNIRRKAAFTLGVLSDERAIPELLNTLKQKETVMRLISAEMLGGLGDEQAISGLLDALRDQSVQVRRKAAESLGKLGKDEAIPELLNSLESPSSFDRDRAVELLVKLNSNQIIDELVEKLLCKPPYVSVTIVRVLKDLDQNLVTAKLINRLKTNSSEIRRKVIKYLGYTFKDRELVAATLLKYLEDEDADVRRETAEILGELGYQEAIPELLVALKHQKAGIRRKAAEILGGLGHQEAIPELLNSLESTISSIIGCRAAEVLVTSGHEKLVFEFLQSSRGHKYEGANVKEHVAVVLGRFGHPSLLSDLWQAQIEKPRSYLQKTIAAIQSRCQFYNYEIFQAHLAAQKADRQIQPNRYPNAITIQTLESLAIMTDKAPIFNQQQATIGVNYAAEGSNIEFTQHASASEQTFELLLTDYQQFIQQLQQKYPTVADPTTVPQIIEVEAKLIEAQDHHRWQNFLNLKRLWNGSKKAGVRVGEHFAENNVWAKGAIAFLEGVSEDGK